MAVNLRRLRNLAEQLRERSPEAAAEQRTGRSWYRIANAATDRAEVYLYDIIGDWGVTADEFVAELRAVKAPRIDLHVNCEGGQVFDGTAIYENLCQHPAYVTAYVDGIAASAASFIVQAADRRVMGRNARMMIHDAHGLVIGNAADMREMAILLDDLSDEIASIYADRAGGTTAQWRDAMYGPRRASDGTWYSAQAALDAGLADEIAARPARTDDGGADDAADDRAPAAAVAAWDPAALLSTLQEATAPPAPPPPPLAWNPGELAAFIREVAA